MPTTLGVKTVTKRPHLIKIGVELLCLTIGGELFGASRKSKTWQFFRQNDLESPEISQQRQIPPRRYMNK